MTPRTDAALSCISLFHPFMLFVILTMLTGIACQQAKDAPANAKATPANVAAEAKPTETQAKQADPAPAGKEIKPADGPALKSITPVEGTILGGVLNDIAVSLPAPDAEAVKKANASGTVTVEVVVTEKGVVSSYSVVSGPQELWSAASAAARQARFEPPLHNGKPVKVAGVLIYEIK